MEKETAIKVLKELHDKSLFAERTALETLIPELKESEDEKIRKALVDFMTIMWGNQQDDICGVNVEDAIAWLEKQGEHKKFRDSIQVGDEVTRNSDGVIVNLSQLKRVAKKSEQKLPIEKLPSEMKTIGESLGFTTQEECDEYNEMVTNLIMGDDDKGEQKSAWSREDEKIRQTIINEFKQCSEWYCSNGLTKEDCINWLNKQEYFEWGDEDNENMNSLCVLLDQMVSINAIGNEHSIEYKNWLKSIKQRMGG